VHLPRVPTGKRTAEGRGTFHSGPVYQSCPRGRAMLHSSLHPELEPDAKNRDCDVEMGGVAVVRASPGKNAGIGAEKPRFSSDRRERYSRSPRSLQPRIKGGQAPTKESLWKPSPVVIVPRNRARRNVSLPLDRRRASAEHKTQVDAPIQAPGDRLELSGCPAPTVVSAARGS